MQTRGLKYCTKQKLKERKNREKWRKKYDKNYRKIFSVAREETN